ncbi:MATE family efflux transporter [Candidatus Marinimicrobia bacterium]|nr:MATE family efflux transporter [Candidatus Neomarinimicrobiota bacterium]
MEKESRLQSFLGNPSKALWTMALPIIAGMMVQTLFNVVDIMFIGWLGAEEVTAVAFVSPLFFIIIGLTVGLGAGVTASIAQFIGQKDKKNADNCAEHTILLGLVITLVLSFLGIVFAEELLVLLGASGNILDISYTYLKVLLYGIGLAVFSLFFRAILAGEGETKIPMFIGLIGTLLNLILDPIFIFVLEYGVKGAALATVISQAVMVISYLFIIFVRKSTYITFNISDFKYSSSIISTIFKIGIPSSISMLIISFGQVVMNRILINYSVEAVAAYQIVSRIDMLLFMPILGIAISLTTIVGMFFGAKEYEKLVSIVKYGISRAIYITLLSVAILFILADRILPLFSDDPEVLNIGITYLRIIILAYPAVGLSVICSRICQALGEGMPLLVTTITRVLIITAPLSYYFYITGKPIEWVWYAQVFAILIAATISFGFLRYYSKKFAIV